MINWHLTYRDADVSTYSDGHGAYTVITHSREICNEKITPPLAMKKDREGFNNNYPLLQQVCARSQQKKLPLGRNRHIGALNEHIESDCKRR